MQNLVVSSDHKTLTFYPRPASGYGTASKDGLTASKLNTTAIKNTTAKMNEAVKKMTGSTTYEQVKAIHDGIINKTQYLQTRIKATHISSMSWSSGRRQSSLQTAMQKQFRYAC